MAGEQTVRRDSAEDGQAPCSIWSSACSRVRRRWLRQRGTHGTAHGSMRSGHRSARGLEKFREDRVGEFEPAIAQPNSIIVTQQ
jgi:hypothetical protein